MESPSSVLQYPSSPFSPKKRVGSLVAARMNALAKDDPSSESRTGDSNRQTSFRLEKEIYLAAKDLETPRPRCLETSSHLTLKEIVADSPCTPRSPRRKLVLGQVGSSRVVSKVACPKHLALDERTDPDEHAPETDFVRPQFQRYQSARTPSTMKPKQCLQTQASAPNLGFNREGLTQTKSNLRRSSHSSKPPKSVRFHVCSTRLFDKRLAPRAVSRVRTTHKLMNPAENGFTPTDPAPPVVPLPKSPVPRRFSNGEEDAPNPSATYSPRSPVRRPSPNPASLLQLLVPPPPLETEEVPPDGRNPRIRRTAPASPVRRPTFLPPAPLSGTPTSPRSVQRPSRAQNSPKPATTTGPIPSSSSFPAAGPDVGSPKKVNMIQASARGYMQRFRETQGMFETDPARREQARLRQEQRDREKQGRAAVQIQSAARLYLGRRRAHLLRLEARLLHVEASGARELQRIEQWKRAEMARIRAELEAESAAAANDAAEEEEEEATVDPSVLRAVDELQDQNQALRRSGRAIRRECGALQESNRKLEARLSSIRGEIRRREEDIEPLARSNDQWASINEMYAAQAARYGPAIDELVALSESEKRMNMLIQRTMVRVLEKVEQSQRRDPANASLFAAALELASTAPWNPQYGGAVPAHSVVVDLCPMEARMREDEEGEAVSRAKEETARA